MKTLIYSSSEKKMVKKLSNKFSNRDYSLLNALSYLKGYKLSKATKSIIIGESSFSLRKVNGFIYAGDKCLSYMINDKVIKTSKFLKALA